MKSHSQLDLRENTAPRRQHASRSAVLAIPKQSTSTTTEDNVSLISVSSDQEPLATQPNNAARTAATGSDEKAENQLLKRQHIQGFVMEKMLRQGLSWKTTLHLRNLLGTIFTTAVEWEYVQANPARGVKLPLRPLRQQARFLTTDDVKSLLAALEEPVRTLVLTAVLTGMRIGELLALRWKNVDNVRKVICVRETVYEGHASTPKTRSGNRDVPMGPTLEEVLRQHAARARTSEDSLVFATRSGTYLRPGNLHKRHLLPVCAKAGLRAFSWHDFRRTHATLLSDMGEPLKTAQAQLGHANLSTTAEIYAQVVPASQRAAVERLEQAVGFLVDPSGPKTEDIVVPGSLSIQ
jgi:integrase